MDGEQNGTQAQQVEQPENQTPQQQEGRQEAQGKHAKEAGADAGMSFDWLWNTSVMR